VPFSIEVPKKLAGGRGEIEILGGGSDYLDVYDLGSVAEVKAALRRDLRNDATGLRGKITSEKGKVTFKDESAPLDLVVLRGRSVRVVVK
jgi:hypothetical protein